jgi:hypothetical protein
MIGKPYKMLSKIGYNGAMIIQHRFYALSDYIPYLKTNLHNGADMTKYFEKTVLKTLFLPKNWHNSLL